MTASLPSVTPSRAVSKTRDWWWSSLVPLIGLAAVYLVTGSASLELASLHQSASPVWPPSGIALAAVILYGRRVWPAILAGAFLVNFIELDDGAVALGMATGNTLEALVGGLLVTRFARGHRFLETAGTVLRFVFWAGLVAPIASATLGVASLMAGDLAASERPGSIWFTWWVGDVVGILLVTPLVVVWRRVRFRSRHDLAVLAETVGAVALTTLVAAIVFSGLLPAPIERLPIAFLCFPPLLWPVFRLGRRGTVASLAALALVALVSTMRGDGPFAAGYDLNTSLLLVQAFVGTIVVMNLVLAALVGERWRTSRALERSQTRLSSQLLEIEDLYRTAPVGLCLLDADLRYVRINSRLAEINGLHADLHLGKTVRDVVPTLADRTEPLLRRVLASGRPLLDQEVQNGDPQSGGGRHWLESYYPVRGPRGTIDGVSCVVQDITALKSAEEAEQTRRRLEHEVEARRRVDVEVATAVERERLLLGQELHEGLGQDLAGIGYLLATLQGALRKAGVAQAEEALRLGDMITRSIERTRHLAKAFYPVEMETLGLVGSLEEMADKATNALRIQCRVRDVDAPAADMRGPMAIQLFRIAQEAIHYEVTQGQASRIDISISVDSDRLVLTVAGNGVPGELESKNGAGVRMMRYRAGVIGGSLDVRSPPAGGTTVRCSAPLPPAAVA